MPAKPAPASSTTARCVFRTEPTMVSVSIGPQRPRVDDLDGDAVLGELLGDLEGAVHHAHVGDHGDVGALAADDGLAERDQEVGILRHLALDGVERLRLDEDDRVVVADGRLQEALGIGGCRGPHDLEPGHVVEVRLHALRVLGRELGRRARRARGRRAGYCTARPTCRASWPPS